MSQSVMPTSRSRWLVTDRNRAGGANAPERSLFVSRGWFVGVFGRVGLSRGGTGGLVVALVVGSGNDCSEVPVFRDLPAALDFRVAPDCLPGPRFVQRVASSRRCR